MKETILIIEDEKDIVKMLDYNLKKKGHHEENDFYFNRINYFVIR